MRNSARSSHSGGGGLFRAAASGSAASGVENPPASPRTTALSTDGFIRVVRSDNGGSALDPIATARVEELMAELRERYTIIIVTHNMQQASRVSDYTAFLYLGQLVEYQETDKLFIKPMLKETEDYITGRFG